MNLVEHVSVFRLEASAILYKRANEAHFRLLPITPQIKEEGDKGQG